MYRYLHLNDSIKNSKLALKNFYNAQAGSSIERFMRIEEHLMTNNLLSAASDNYDIAADNDVESRYQQYYNLYISYAGNHFLPTTATDSSNLKALADLCPGTDGACVYQARALYNSVYGEALEYGPCSGSSERTLPLLQAKSQSIPWTVDLYPNPASNYLVISSNTLYEFLLVQVHDLSGRVIFNKTVKPNGLISNLDLDLLNGAYFISIDNENNERVIKKLIVVK